MSTAGSRILRTNVTAVAATGGLILSQAQLDEAAIAVMGGRDIPDALLDVAVQTALEEDVKTDRDSEARLSGIFRSVGR